jgi:hypothetical protein
VRARLSVLVAVAALSALPAAAPALAQDTDAPPGAGKNWLPSEDWVIRHWIPFDERRLHRALRVRRHDVFRWLDDYDHTIAGLARRQGLNAERLVRRLVRPWRDTVGSKRYALLRSRTRRVLTQSHLSRHLLFHVFHNRRIGENAPALFGVDKYTWWDMRRSGHTVMEVARRGGRGERQVRKRLLRFLAREQRVGVKRLLTPRRQARRLYGTQRRLLKRWMRENRLRVPDGHRH